jgi:hypothetical protein
LVQVALNVTLLFLRAVEEVPGPVLFVLLKVASTPKERKYRTTAVFLFLPRDAAEVFGLCAATVILIEFRFCKVSTKSRRASFCFALKTEEPGLKNTLAVAAVVSSLHTAYNVVADPIGM